MVSYWYVSITIKCDKQLYATSDHDSPQLYNPCNTLVYIQTRTRDILGTLGSIGLYMTEIEVNLLNCMKSLYREGLDLIDPWQSHYLPVAGGWNLIILGVPSNPSNSMTVILRFTTRASLTKNIPGRKREPDTFRYSLILIVFIFLQHREPK